MIHFDRVIANLRRSGLTYKQLGAKLGVTGRAVESWVSGERKLKNFDTVIAILDLHYDRCRDRHRVEVIGAP